MKKILSFLFLVIMGNFNLLYSQWVHINGAFGTYVESIVASSGKICASDLDSLYFSSDNGTTWTKPIISPGVTSVNALTNVGKNTFIGTNIGVFLSTDSCASWNPRNNGLSDYIRSLVVLDSNLIVVASSGVFGSTNIGVSWNEANIGITNPYLRSLAVYKNTIFVGGIATPSPRLPVVFRSTNVGASWDTADGGIREFEVRTFAISDTCIYAGTDKGVYYSTNEGASWRGINNGLLYGVHQLVLYDSHLFAGTEYGVYLLNSSDTSWTMVSTGLEGHGMWIFALAISHDDLWAGTMNGVWKRPLSQMLVTSVNQSVDNVPSSFALEQNFPNPFNPATNISFSVQQESFVTLKIFDVLGQQVAELIANVVPSGKHVYQWNPKDLPSGIYFYRLNADAHFATKKCIYLK